MTAAILRPGGPDDGDPDTGSPNGRFEYKQDPYSGASIKIWVPAGSTVEEEDGSSIFVPRRIKCSARAISEGGIRVAATTERYSTRGTLETSDYINFECGPREDITRGDRIYDIRNRTGELIWKEEEYSDLPTIFEVTGVRPLTDPRGRLVKQMSLLERVDDQGQFWRTPEGQSWKEANKNGTRP